MYDQNDAASKAAFPKKVQLIHLVWLSLTKSTLLRILQQELDQAWFQFRETRNYRLTSAHLAMIYRVRELWKNRALNPAIAQAQRLMAQGWRLSGDWTMKPPKDITDKPIFGVRLSKRIDPHLPDARVEFVWDTEADVGPVPLDRLYLMLRLEDHSARELILAWQTCFWLDFLTQEEILRHLACTRTN